MRQLLRPGCFSLWALAFVSGCSAHATNGGPLAMPDAGGRAAMPDAAAAGPPLPGCTPEMASATPAAPPTCAGQPILEATDDTGATRWACLVSPPNVSGPLPLMVYLHPSTKAVTYTTTSPFADKIAGGDLTGGGALGFYVLVPQSQRKDKTAVGGGYAWDASDYDPSTNHDIIAVDRLIAAAKARVAVDEQRVFLTGWSSGSYFAALYGFVRPSVAAAAVYAGASPGMVVPTSCAAPLQAQRQTPFYEIHHSCDAIVPCPAVEQLMSSLGAGWPSRDVILDAQDNDTQSCDSTCPFAAGAMNHVTFPTSREDEMLAWLRAHPNTP